MPGPASQGAAESLSRPLPPNPQPSAPVSAERGGGETEWRAMTDSFQVSAQGAVRTERSAVFGCSVLELAEVQCCIHLGRYDLGKKTTYFSFKSSTFGQSISAEFPLTPVFFLLSFVPHWVVFSSLSVLLTQQEVGEKSPLRQDHHYFQFWGNSEF